MSLFKRFASNRPGNHLHSSGIVNDSSTMGAVSAESFEQRQSVDKTRQFVASYRDAGVLHNYRKTAQDELVSTTRQEDDKDGKHHKKHLRSKVIPRTSRIENRSTSRIENPRTSRIDTVTRSQSGAVQRSRASFSEPQGRRYNPFG